MTNLFLRMRRSIHDWICGPRKELLSGTFADWLDLSNGHHSYFTFRLSETSNHSLKIQGGVSGDDSEAFYLEGNKTANNGFSVYGQIGGAAVDFNLVVKNKHTILVSDATGKSLGTWRRVL